MDFNTLTFFIAGLILLVVGAELLVRGASRLAAACGISPLVIGLTVVAFGTSAPELAVSIQSTIAGQADIALGNAVGSNIFNVLFILGISALITPLVVAQQLIRLDVPIMIGVSLLLALLALDGRLQWWDGLVLVSGIVAYTVFGIRQSRKENAQVVQEYQQEFGGDAPTAGSGTVVQVLFVIVGLLLLVFGARWLVSSAITIAQLFGLSELVIGLTIVAAGTSLPEVATSIIASLRGERDIAVGNVVGSNIFNILAILGIAATVADQGIVVAPASLRFDIPVMIAAAIACLPIFLTDHLIARWEGALFLAYYVAYTLYLVLDATHHDALPRFSAMMLEFVVPLTIITLGIVTVRSLRASARDRTTDNKQIM